MYSKYWRVGIFHLGLLVCFFLLALFISSQTCYGTNHSWKINNKYENVQYSASKSWFLEEIIIYRNFKIWLRSPKDIQIHI